MRQEVNELLHVRHGEVQGWQVTKSIDKVLEGQADKHVYPYRV